MISLYICTQKGINTIFDNIKEERYEQSFIYIRQGNAPTI